MDIFVEQKLEEWGLSEYLDSFKDNLIDEETFLLLDADTVKELIVPLGPRLKALRHLEALRELSKPETSAGSSSSSRPNPESTASSRSDPESTPPSGLTSDCTPSSGPNPDTPGTSSDCTNISSSLTKSRSNLFFDIHEILQAYNGGDDIKEEMESGLISHKSRIKAVRLFVSHLIERFGDRPKSHVKEALARSIVDTFPSLKGEDSDGHEAWYTPSINTHPATGYLEERLRNVRKRSAKLGLDGTDSPKQRKVTEVPSPPAPPVALAECEDEPDSDAIDSMVQWLKHNKEPIEKVREYHRKTAKARLLLIRENPKVVFTKYPRLLDTPGLIHQDFNVLHPLVGDNLFLLWTPAVARKLLQYADKQNGWFRHLGVDGDHSTLTDDEVCNLSLQCLPCILPLGTRKENGKPRRATIDDALNTFVQLQHIGTNIPQFLEEVKQCQPFILAFGNRLNPEQVNVIIEREAIPAVSMMRAVDLLFKCFYVFNISYPMETASTWQFLQCVIYGIGVKGAKLSSAAVSMKAFLKLKKPSTDSSSA